MACDRARLLAWLVVSLLGVHWSAANVHTVEVTADPREHFHVSRFGYIRGGALELHLAKLSVQSRERQGPFKMGVLVKRSETAARADEMDLPADDECVLEGPVNDAYYCVQVDPESLAWLEPRVGKALAGQINVTRGEIAGHLTMSILEKKGEGIYLVDFVNCANHGTDSKTSLIGLSMRLDITEYNPGPNYLSAGLVPLPSVFFLMSLVYFPAMAMAWALALYRAGRTNVFKTHAAMLALVIFKAAALALHAYRLKTLARLGSPDSGWKVVYYIFHLLKGMLLFTTVLLVGAGMVFVKPYLSAREKVALLAVIALAVLADVAQVIVDEEEISNRDYSTWCQMLMLIDVVCCVVVLMPIYWTLKHLREATQAGGKTAITLARWRLFRAFLVAVVIYIYFTRFAFHLLGQALPFNYRWVADMCNEVATAIFFVWTAVQFRPGTDNPYFKLGQDEDESSLPDVRGGNAISMQSFHRGDD